MADPYQDGYDFGYKSTGQIYQNALAHRAGGMLARGDQTGAANALFSGGELDAGAQVQARQAAQDEAKRKQQADALDKLTTGVGRMLEDPEYGANPGAVWETAKAAAQRLGIDPNVLTAHEADFARDPKGWALMWNGAAKKEKAEFAKGSDGSYTAADPYTGKPLYQYQAPTPDKYEAQDPEKDLYRIPGRPGGMVGPAEAPQGPPTTGPNPPGQPSDWLAPIAEAAPDAQVTSGYRTPADQERLRRQGYTPAQNSRHLSGQAVDLVPRPGETMAQLYNRVRRIPGTRAINEGTHVHVQVTGGGQAPPAAPQGGPELVRAARPQAGGHMATPQEKAALGLTGDLPVWIGKDGKPDVVSGTGANLKPIPVPIQKGIIENRANLRQIDQAIAAIEANPRALGWGNIVGDEITQRIPGKAGADGIPARSSVANIGSLIIHDRSGAAVTVAETPRLKPFVPMPTDGPEAAKKKLAGLRQQIVNTLTETELAYGEDSGYRPFGGGSAPAAAPTRAPAPAAKASNGPRRLSPAEAAKLKPGTKFIGQDGVERVRQ